MEFSVLVKGELIGYSYCNITIVKYINIASITDLSLCLLVFVDKKRITHAKCVYEQDVCLLHIKITNLHHLTFLSNCVSLLFVDKNRV